MNHQEKTQKFLKQIRNQFKEKFMTQRREKIIMLHQKQYQEQLFSQQLQAILNKQDINEIYDFMCFEKATDNFYKLKPFEAIQLYGILKKDLMSLRCIVMLGNLMKEQYLSIFHNETLTYENQAFITSLYQICNSYVQEISCIHSTQQNYSEKLKDIHERLNAYLTCLQFLEYQRSRRQQLQADQKKLLLTQKCKNKDYFEEYIVQWFPFLHTNTRYLVVFAFLLEDSNFFEENSSSKTFIKSNEHLFLKILEQTNCNNETNQIASLPCAVIILNIFTAKQISVQFLESNMYLLINLIQNIYKGMHQKKGKKYYNINLFFTSIKTLRDILRRVDENEQNKINIGQKCQINEFLNHLKIILYVEVQAIRKVVLEIMQLLIKNLMQNGFFMLQFITDDLVHSFVGGLEQSNNEIILQSLKILQLLIQYAQQQSMEEEIQNHPFVSRIIEYEAALSLEGLQYHKNQDIKQLAIFIENHYPQLFKAS